MVLFKESDPESDGLADKESDPVSDGEPENADVEPNSSRLAHHCVCRGVTHLDIIVVVPPRHVHHCKL